MIIRLMILAWLFILQAVVNLLPVGVLPLGVYGAMTTALGYLSGWSLIFPVSTFLTVIGLSLTLQFFVWVWEGGVWVYNKIRGI